MLTNRSGIGLVDIVDKFLQQQDRNSCLFLSSASSQPHGSRLLLFCSHPACALLCSRANLPRPQSSHVTMGTLLGAHFSTQLGTSSEQQTIVRQDTGSLWETKEWRQVRLQPWGHSSPKGRWEPCRLFRGSGPEAALFNAHTWSSRHRGAVIFGG